MHDYYDAVWVYGDSEIYDLVNEHKFSPALAAKTRYTGYLDQRRRLHFTDGEVAALPEKLGLPQGRLSLCLVGGGVDGGALAIAFAQAELPPEMNGIILTGPYMPAEEEQSVRCHAARNPRLRVVDFVAEPAPLLQRADRVVAMGGYNTVSEVLCFEKPALLVPRLNPPEQRVRAERLQALGLADLLYPDTLTPPKLSAWLASPLERPRVHERINFAGLDLMPQLLEELLARRGGRAPGTNSDGELQLVAV
jgi:predicted glycosyltransferase